MPGIILKLRLVQLVQTPLALERAGRTGGSVPAGSGPRGLALGVRYHDAASGGRYRCRTSIKRGEERYG